MEEEEELPTLRRPEEYTKECKERLIAAISYNNAALRRNSKRTKFKKSKIGGKTTI